MLLETVQARFPLTRYLVRALRSCTQQPTATRVQIARWRPLPINLEYLETEGSIPDENASCCPVRRASATPGTTGQAVVRRASYCTPTAASR